MSFPFRAKARPNKKAKLNKPLDDNPTDDNPAAELEKTSEAFDQNTDIILDDLVPQAQDTFVESVEINLMSQSADPPSPTRTTDKPPSRPKLLMTMLLFLALGLALFETM